MFPQTERRLVRNTLTRTQKPNVTQAACSQDATRKGLLEDGVNMHYNYFDEGGEHILSFAITERSCR